MCCQSQSRNPLKKISSVEELYQSVGPSTQWNPQKGGQPSPTPDETSLPICGLLKVLQVGQQSHRTTSTHLRFDYDSAEPDNRVPQTVAGSLPMGFLAEYTEL